MNETSSGIEGMVLAAGSSSRMGQSKQLLEIHGEKLLRRTVKVLLEAGITRTTVVLGSEESAHRQVIEKLPIRSVRNSNWPAGMGSSIKCGLREILLNNPAVQGVLISVCDQPLLTPEVLTSLTDHYHRSGSPIIAAHYSGTPGVPVIFNKNFFHALMNLPDREGAKRIVLQNLSVTTLVPFPGGEIDLDTWDDYLSFLGGDDKQ